MHYQLPNGRVIEISTEQYFEMSDEELEYLIAYNYGDVIEDPWFGSVLSKNSPVVEDDTQDITPDLTSIPTLTKLKYEDIDFKPEQEE